MAGTRSSTRNASNGSNPTNEDDVAAGTKRKAGSTPKKERKAAKKQSTIEETIGSTDNKDISEDTEMKEAHETDANTRTDETKRAAEDVDAGSKDGVEEEGTGDDESEVKDTNGDSTIEESSERANKLPSNILEKGIVYFFIRNRVGVEDAESVGDLQRTYFVLRPLPTSAQLGDGPIPDLKNNRLFALPKKVFPKSHSDRFMAFVEKGNATIQDLKDSFFQGEERETKTAGTRRTEPPTTVAEGVYAITRTEDRTTHLAYAITIPSDLGEVQEDLGLRPEGSFIISVKNPERPGPASARLPKSPEFPQDIIEEFRGLAWAEVKPNYLDYENCQILLIGENTEKAVQATTKDKKHDKETPKEELDELEHEDELRVEHLHGDDSVFDDLKLSKKDYPKVPTTW